MDKQIVVYPYNGILPGNKQKFIELSIHPIDESQKHYTHNARVKDYKLHDSICTKMLKMFLKKKGGGGRTCVIKSSSGTGMVAHVCNISTLGGPGSRRTA